MDIVLSPNDNLLLLCICCYSDIVHWYHSKENDWGYGNFMAWQVMDFIFC